ncbi:MAG: ABC transporter permease [Alphaproteobacteria bacterium]
MAAARPRSALQIVGARLLGWEGFLLLILVATVVANAVISPEFLTVGNIVNLFQLSSEKIVIALVMTLIIINGEIDLSVGSMMGLSACLFGWLFEHGVAAELAIVIALAAGALGGAFNAFWITRIGLPSLVVTLAMMIGFSGVARILVEDRGVTGFPDWFDALGREALIGPLPLALVVFAVLLVTMVVVLHFSGFGRQVYVIGNNKEMARYSGVRVNRVKAILFIASGTVSALAGLLYTMRVASVRGDIGTGFELDIITIVLLGGISIFGGSGTLFGALLAILIVLNLRNGMQLVNITGHIQTGVIGLLLILSVLVPNGRAWLGGLIGRTGARQE